MAQRAAIALAAFGLTASLAFTHEYKSGRILVVHPYATPTMPGATAGTAYMKIINGGKRPIRLMSASTPMAASVEFHSMTMTNGIMRMRPVAAGILLPRHGEVRFAPGGFHMMLVGLKKPLAEEEMVPLTLHFKGAPDVKIELYIENMPSGSHAH